jgi:hypothetical protein
VIGEKNGERPMGIDQRIYIIAVPINWEHASVIAKTQHNSTSGSLRGGQVDHFPVRLLIDAV